MGSEYITVNGKPLEEHFEKERQRVERIQRRIIVKSRDEDLIKMRMERERPVSVKKGITLERKFGKGVRKHSAVKFLDADEIKQQYGVLSMEKLFDSTREWKEQVIKALDTFDYCPRVNELDDILRIMFKTDISKTALRGRIKVMEKDGLVQRVDDKTGEVVKVHTTKPYRIRYIGPGAVHKDVPTREEKEEVAGPIEPPKVKTAPVSKPDSKVEMALDYAILLLAEALKNINVKVSVDINVKFER